MALLTFLSHVLGYEDSIASNNPTQRAVDWAKGVLNIPVENPKTDPRTIPPQTELVVFDNGITTSIDGTTEFDLTLSSLDSTVYRIEHSAGTPPDFRIARTTVVSGGTITVAVLPNNLVTFTHSATPFAAVVVGDNVFIPGVLTGDPAGPFNSLNEGYWLVVAKNSNAQLTLARLSGTSFQAFSEGPVAIAADSEFQVFSADGVQVGDSVELSLGFQVNALKTFVVLSVTAFRIEVMSTVPLADETGVIPTAAGMQFHKNSKRFLYIEADQECVVRLNGDTGSTNRMSPWTPAEKELRAQYVKVGPAWKLAILNKATVPAKIVVISAE